MLRKYIFLPFMLFVFSVNTSALVVDHHKNLPLKPFQTNYHQKISDSDIPQNGIYYHGGKVMGTTADTIPNIYYIWYGNWFGSTAINLLANFAMGIGKTDYYNVVHTYQDRRGRPVIKAANFPKPAIFDNYSQGKELSDKDVYKIVKNAIDSKRLPMDTNGIYFVLASADVNETSGLCIDYCSWHSNQTMYQKDVKYAFIGNPERCPQVCSIQNITPNNNFAADSMANLIAHELFEVITDPERDGWHDQMQQGVTDKCAWQFGYTKTAPNGSQYNLSIAYVNYLVQDIWLNLNGGYCTGRYYG